jgi:hypothetical protein
MLLEVAARVAVPMACLEGSDSVTRGDPETVVYVNSTAAAQTILIIVDGYFPEGFTFNLTTSIP